MSKITNKYFISYAMKRGNECGYGNSVMNLGESIDIPLIQSYIAKEENAEVVILYYRKMGND
jgi:hypothetical protein